MTKIKNLPTDSKKIKMSSKKKESQKARRNTIINRKNIKKSGNYKNDSNNNDSKIKEQPFASATAEELQLIKEGTIEDKINCATLLCIKNPTEENYKFLLSFAENQRNDIIYLTIKNLTNLLIENIGAGDTTTIGDNTTTIGDNDTSTITTSTDNDSTGGITDYIKFKIIKTFSNNSKNQYICAKVAKKMEKLISHNIFSVDLVPILISRLNLHTNNYLKTVFNVYEELILIALEDFFYKNDNYRSQLNVLKFLTDLTTKNNSLFDFYNTINIDEEYQAHEKEILLGYIIAGIAKNYTSIDAGNGNGNDSVNDHLLRLLKNYKGTNEFILVSGVRLLIKVYKQNYTHLTSFLLKNINNIKSIEMMIINELADVKDQSLFVKLINHSFNRSPAFILSLVMICQNNFKEMPKNLYGMKMMARHWNLQVKETSEKFLEGEKVDFFDPFDKVLSDLKQDLNYLN